MITAAGIVELRLCWKTMKTNIVMVILPLNHFIMWLKNVLCIFLKILLVFHLQFIGYPPQTGTATLRIFVDDINDNAPEFVLPYPPMVMELKDPPQFVITFSAMDRDTPKYGAPFNFSLPSCDKNPTCKNGDLEFTMDFNPGRWTLIIWMIMIDKWLIDIWLIDKWLIHRWPIHKWLIHKWLIVPT